MKKVLTAMALAGAMSLSAICSAAGEGALLTKEQKAAEAFTAAATGKAEATYATASAGLTADLKAKVDEKAFGELQKQIKEKLGAAKEINFRAFEHFKDGDRVVYLGSFAKEQNVVITYLFDSTAKIANFAFTPVKPQPAQQAPAKK
ncbi:MAG: DUF3887 domain-containing protein [Phascolarctobacterium sp.]|nr:DUF3887 domain-containing protein [Phascolarctobacterium sp.]